MEETILNTEEKMMLTIESLENKFTNVRAGRANPSMLDGVMVEYYGTPTPLKSLANISVPEARQLSIKPFDRSCLGAIEKAIFEANLGVTPNNNGEVVFIVIPPLTEDRRKDLVKQVKQLAEEAKIALRNIRQDANKALSNLELPEDEEKRGNERVQELINEYNKIVMKEVFMPSMDELYKMQDMGADLKLYLYAKAIEALCIEYNNFPRKGSILKNEFKYIREDEKITQAVCMMYPREIEFSEVSKYNPILAKQLITRKESRDIYRLDNISSFYTCASDNLTPEAVDILSKELPNNPKYRFEYKQSKLNSVLDDIFMGKINIDNMCLFMNNEQRQQFISKLSKIEPYYVMQLMDSENKSSLLRLAVIEYINRYGFNYISEGNKQEDILTNQTTEVKRLFRCIKRK